MGAREGWRERARIGRLERDAACESRQRGSLEDRVFALEQGTEQHIWPPMDEAPEDGLVILVYDAKQMLVFKAYRNGDFWVERETGKILERPQVWTYLPHPHNV